MHCCEHNIARNHRSYDMVMCHGASISYISLTDAGSGDEASRIERLRFRRCMMADRILGTRLDRIQNDEREQENGAGYGRETHALPQARTQQREARNDRPQTTRQQYMVTQGAKLQAFSGMR